MPWRINDNKKKKQEQVEKEQREVSDEMPAVPAPDVPSRVNDEAEIAARRAQQVYIHVCRDIHICRDIYAYFTCLRMSMKRTKSPRVVRNR